MGLNVPLLYQQNRHQENRSKQNFLLTNSGFIGGIGKNIEGRLPRGSQRGRRKITGALREKACLFIEFLD
jgi:hypothetical protein